MAATDPQSAGGMDAQEVEKLAHGTSITFVGGITNSGFQYLTGMVVSRLVGPELVGAYFLSLIWTQLVSVVTRLGFADALLRFLPPARLQGDDAARLRLIKTVLCIGAVVASVVGIGLALGVGPLLQKVGAEPLFARYLPWFFFAVPLNVLLILMLMTVQAHQDMTPVVFVRDLIQPGFLLLFTVGLLVVASPVVALAAGFGLSLLMGLFAIGWRLHRLAPGLVSVGGWAALGPLLGYSMPVMLGDVSHYLYRWIDSITISYFLDIRDVGIYNAAVRTSLLIALVHLAVNAIFATMASGFFHTGQHDRLRAVLHLSTRWCLVLALPMGCVFVVSGDAILGLWGAEFVQGAPVLSILVVAQLLTVPAGLLGYTLLMCQRQVVELVNTIITLVLIGALNVVLIPRYGLLGAASALVLSNVFGLGLRWVQVYHLFHFHAFDRRVYKPLAAAGVAVAAAYALRLWLAGEWPDLFGGLHGVLAALRTVALFGGAAAGGFVAVYLALGFEDEDRMIPALLLARIRGAAPAGGAP